MHAAIVVTPTPPLPDTTVMTARGNPKLGTASDRNHVLGRHSRNTPPMHAAIVVTPTPPLPDTTVMTAVTVTGH